MALDPAKFVTYKSLLVPAASDDVSPVGGGIDVPSGAVAQNTPNLVIPTAPIPASDVFWRYKLFRRNENPATAYRARGWVLNSLQGNHTAGQASVKGTNAAQTGYARLFGTVAGVHKTDDVLINGTTSTLGAEVFDSNSIYRAQSLSPAKALLDATYPIEITRGTLQGTIPAGVSCVTAEFEFAFDLTVDGTLQAANRLTDPAGISFAKALDEASAVNGPATIAQNQAVGYWFRFRRIGGSKPPVERLVVVARIKFDDAE